jgi:hypothetical protein
MKIWTGLRLFGVAVIFTGLPAGALAQTLAPTADAISFPAPSSSPFAPNANVAQQPADAPADPVSDQQTAAAIIKASQNPVGNIGIVPFQNNYNYGYGLYQRGQYNLNIQPVVPIQLSPSANLIARAIIPLINQPSAAPPAVCVAAYGCPSTFGLGDINLQLFYAPRTKPDAFIWGAGAQLLFPSANPTGLGAGKYGVGPAIVGLIMPGNIVTGVLVTETWSIGGDPTRPPISLLFIQPIFNYNFKGGWTLFFGSSGITDNFNATPQQGKWLVPIGVGVTKTFKLGDQPMQLGFQYFANVVRPVNAAYGTLRLNFALLFPVKR